MTDTAQPVTAAETEVELTREDALNNAASAFKVALGQEEPAERQRDAQGRFTSADAGEEEIEATDEADEAEAGAESQDEGDAEDEAPDEGQPDADALPESWPSDKAELWEELPAEAQAYIRERDAQQKAAVGAKFQEAANLRKAHEAEINLAIVNGQRYSELSDHALGVLAMFIPPEPPRSMLDINSSDYDPDAYHYQKATRADLIGQMNFHAAHRKQMTDQEQGMAFQALNNATRDAFVKAVPDVADQAKAPAVFQGLIEYAVEQGAPPETFNSPTTALEWHVLWKAREYDRLQKAKAQVRTDPKPEPRKPQPALRPGVTTPRSAIENQKRKGALDRLAREGSIDAGAAVIKQMMKGLNR